MTGTRHILVQQIGRDCCVVSGPAALVARVMDRAGVPGGQLDDGGYIVASSNVAVIEAAAEMLGARCVIVSGEAIQVRGRDGAR